MKTLRIIAPLALLLAACGGNPMMDEATGENSGKGGAGAAAAGGAGGTSAGTGGALGDQQGGASGAATGGAPAGTGGASAEGGQGGRETGGAGGAGGAAGTGGAAVTGGAGPGEMGGAGGGSGDPEPLTCPQSTPPVQGQGLCGVNLGPGNFDSRWKDGLECTVCTKSGRQVTGCTVPTADGGQALCVQTCAECCYRTPGRACATDADCCAPMKCNAAANGAKSCG